MLPADRSKTTSDKLSLEMFRGPDGGFPESVHILVHPDHSPLVRRLANESFDILRPLYDEENLVRYMTPLIQFKGHEEMEPVSPTSVVFVLTFVPSGIYIVECEVSETSPTIH